VALYRSGGVGRHNHGYPYTRPGRLRSDWPRLAGWLLAKPFFLVLQLLMSRAFQDCIARRVCAHSEKDGTKIFIGLIGRYKGVDKLIASAELSLAAPVVGDPSLATEVGPRPRRDPAGFGSLRRAQTRCRLGDRMS
jgi:hypothetical protein